MLNRDHFCALLQPSDETQFVDMNLKHANFVVASGCWCSFVPHFYCICTAIVGLSDLGTVTS